MYTVRQVLRAASVIAASLGPSSVHAAIRDAFARNPLWNGQPTRFWIGARALGEPVETFSGHTRVYVFPAESGQTFPPRIRAEPALQKRRSVALNRDNRLPLL